MGAILRQRVRERALLILGVDAQGVGDFVGVNKSTILASMAQIISSAAMLLAGCGILSCAVGFFLQGVVFRSYCKHFFYRVEGVSDGLAGASKPEKTDIEKIRLAISSNAYRDTAVSISNYVATTANTLLCAAFVGLAESSVFSVTLQLVNACVNVSAVMLTTYQPSLQSAYANRDLELERDLSSKSMASFALFYGVCLVLVVFIGMPILGIFKPGIDSRPLLTVLLGLYFFLWKQQSNCAMLIANTNRIPYMWPFVISAGLGIAASYLLLNLLGGVSMAWFSARWLCSLPTTIGNGPTRRLSVSERLIRSSWHQGLSR